MCLPGERLTGEIIQRKEESQCFGEGGIKSILVEQVEVAYRYKKKKKCGACDKMGRMFLKDLSDVLQEPVTGGRDQLLESLKLTIKPL